MKNASNLTSNANASRISLMVLFALLLLSSVGMFAQTAAPVQAITFASEVGVANDDLTTATTVTTTATESNANMNMVSWFMGTKQTPKADMGNAAMNSKKQMINSGIAPNRLLMKAFLKKAANYQSTIA